MTQNQFYYAQLAQTALRDAEAARHYRAQEEQAVNELAENIRHARRAEELEQYRLDENARHNVVSESTNWATLAETVTHNRAGEAISQQSADSQTKNATTNRLKYTLDQTKVAQDYELGLASTSISAKRQEADAQIGTRNSIASMITAEANTRNAESNAKNAATNRGNMFINGWNAGWNAVGQVGHMLGSQQQNASHLFTSLVGLI